MLSRLCEIAWLIYDLQNNDENVCQYQCPMDTVPATEEKTDKLSELLSPISSVVCDDEY